MTDRKTCNKQNRARRHTCGQMLHTLIMIALMIVVGGGDVWGQTPVTITTDDNSNDVIDDGEKALYLIQTNAFQSFYMVPKGTNVNTNNIPGEYMLWYFLDAGTDGGVQYYYIVSNSENKYICHGGGTDNNDESRGVTLVEKDASNEERCKFKLDENGTGSGFYNINAKGNPTYYGLNKQNGSQAFDKPVRLTNASYINDSNSKWKFIPYSGSFIWPSPPFTVSTDLDKHYYKIQNLESNTYYVSTGATPDKVIYASTESNNMVWFLKEAGSDTWFKYYYIVNPEAGNQYMYYSGNGDGRSNQSNAVCVKTYDSGNEDRYQFVVVQTARGDGASRVECYAIIPKLLSTVLWGSSSIGSTTISDGANMGIINSRSDKNKAQWKFNTSDYPLRCATPTITYSSATGKITLSSTTPIATIYYTTDGTTPSSSNGTTYSSAFAVSAATTIKAIATKTGFMDSEVTTKTFNKVATPTIQNNGSNAISITTETEGATIYYTTNGSTPTTSSTEYTGPLTENVSGVTIKAIAVKNSMINSEVGTGSVTLQCARPIISKVGNYATISCSFPSSGVSIYYTKNGGTPSSSSTPYSSSFSVAIGDVIRAIAIATNYSDSEVAERTIHDSLNPTAGIYYINSDEDFETFVDMANADGASYHYVLQANVNASTAITQDFTGTFDGGNCVITGLTHALFNTINGGTVKNVILEDVDISSGTNVGAICNEAGGATKIYNCGVLSGSVVGGTNVGGLVGLINSVSSVRVVNCYNYADVSGSSYAAGIVGKNEGTMGDVRIALCMMYGSVSGASNISPVYGGNHLPNVSDFTEYNYWRYNSGLTYTSGKYNDQLAIDNDEYLTRFPFYRHILNTHREMASYFLFGDYTTEHVGEIGHWVLDKSKAPYPIVEEWQTNTRKVLDASPTNIISSMGTNGYLAVTVNIGSHTYSASLPITDMDEENYDYTWGKVVLPFANEFEVNTDYTKVCTGWKIMGITGGTTGTFSNFNVSDRDCTTKDLFSTTGFIFAQGGNYIVPYNVTAIEITANFATAYYLSDEAYDIGYSGDNTGNNSSYIGRIGLAGSTPNDYHGQTIYKTLASALSAMSASGSTHEQAVVLVGNYHLDNGTLTTANGYTIMSIDADNNQEPDYAIYSNYTTDRPAIPPTRFDFVAMIPIGMSSHINGSKFYPNIPIFKPRGWFELTETSLLRADQFELDSNNFNTSESETRNYRCIINGGYFTQMVRSNANACTKVSYFQIGGKAYIKEFYPGNHSTKSNANKLVPINVTGGEIEQCFMTGYGKGKAYGTDIYFWCAGGKIGKFLGANMEPVYQTNSNTLGNVNLTAKIDHAIIGRFFGGGTSPKARVTGNINVTINNSHVDFYCGGPEFGDMENNKTVTTEANNTYFKEYYGAGFGGTAITYTNDKDVSTNLTLGNNNYPSGYFSECYIASSSTDKGRLKYKTDYGIGSCYKFEFVMHSRGHQSVSRFFTGYSMFSLATTGSVTNVLNDCEIETDFYGAGCQGKVNGTVTSTLTDCTVHGSAFGGGYKAESNQVDVYPATSPTLSSYNSETCIFSDFGTVAPETYEWVQGTSEKKNTADETNKKLYTGTNVTLTELGNVTGAISITINGGKVSEDVFGGGNESKSLDNTTVNLKGNATIYGDVFGGGNKGHVEGSAKVNIMVPDPPVTP